MLSVTLKILNALNALLLGGQLLVTKLLHAIVNRVLLDSVDLLYRCLVFLNLVDYFTVEGCPELFEFWQDPQFLAVGVQSVNLIKHSVRAVDVSLDKLLVNVLFVVGLLLIWVIDFMVLLLAVLFGLLPERVVDQDVVKVFQLLKPEDSLELVPALVTLLA